MMLRGINYRLHQLNQRIAFAARGANHFAKLSQQTNGTRLKVAAVMVGRNDDYMPDFNHRLQATIAWNIQHLIDEVIFIEWNPPAERQLLAHGLTEKFANLRVKIRVCL
jgi:hypothetical protein